LLRDAKTHGPLRLFIFGGREQIAKQAQRNVEQEYPHVRVVGTYSPPLGFETRHSDNEQAVAAVAAADADIVLVALGAPRQELWCHRERARLRCGAALCLGATVDFVAGAIPRAPPWMRRVGLEWVFRVAREPRRLGARYSKDVALFPVLVAREASARRRRPG
jgi:N-acetylglucosaminyldiphosphoundecaprenol N-acetyl-beta-D-mannosaminyltransferase